MKKKLYRNPHILLPDSEASAWMFDEIGQLEEEIERLNKTIATLLADNDSLRAAIERVRTLHRPTFDGAHCVVCYASYSSDWALYPCPTLRALNGEGA
jgi:hypothetical protein